MAVQLTEKGFPMAVKRDYGNFAKASTRLLTPLIEPLGYTPWNIMASLEPRAQFRKEPSGPSE